jgi:hypothetical protein
MVNFTKNYFSRRSSKVCLSSRNSLWFNLRSRYSSWSKLSSGLRSNAVFLKNKKNEFNINCLDKFKYFHSSINLLTERVIDGETIDQYLHRLENERLSKLQLIKYTKDFSRDDLNELGLNSDYISSYRESFP